VAAPKSKLTKDELKQLKGTLLEIREKLTRQIGSMEGEALGEAGSEVSVDHMADHGTDTFDQDFTLGLIENEENTIREIDAALERMNEGTYGMCEPCVEQMAKLCKTCPHIPKARLEAIPYTRYCVEYAKIAERDREIEEAQEEEEE
jgi:RNA polymerase-binding transcription factor DksA